MKRGHVKEVIGKIGVGKESGNIIKILFLYLDIYKCIGENDEIIILKFARLGRISFRTIRNNRDYLRENQ
jgi:RIO kinase 2